MLSSCWLTESPPSLLNFSTALAAVATSLMISLAETSSDPAEPAKT